jgi:hypothetical protein
LVKIGSERRTGVPTQNATPGKLMPPIRILEHEEIVQLLWREVQKAGTQTAWAKRNGVDRTELNRVLHHSKPPTQAIIRALGLRTVIVTDGD